MMDQMMELDALLDADLLLRDFYVSIQQSQNV